MSQYKILALIELHHDYYADLQSRDFSVVPSPDTAAHAGGIGVVCKLVGNKIAVLMRVDAAGRPLTGFLPDQRLSFYLVIDNVHFYNLTNIGVQSATQRYYFSNLKNNFTGGKRYLTAPVAAYNSSKAYPIGSLAASGGEVYEAIRASSSGNVHGVAEAGYWIKKSSRQYATGADLMRFCDRIYSFSLPLPGTNFLVRVFGLNSETGNFDLEVLPSEVQTYETDQDQVQVKLDGLSAGRYIIDVNGTQKEIYYDPAAMYRGVFAVIDLYNHLPGGDNFSLLDNSGVIKETNFTIGFAARSVIWKYMVSSDVTAITDGSGKYTFSPDGSSKYFYSDKPIPLSDRPLNALSLTSTRLGTVDALANPATDRLSSMVLGGETYYCIEKYLYY